MVFVSVYYPVFLNLSNKLCVVIGGGKVAERKVCSLLDCKARVKVVSPELTPRLKNMVAQGKIECKRGDYAPEDLNNAYLVISATGDREVNESVSKECMERGIPVNVVDTPSLADFIVPATVRRGPLILAVSTSGESPLLARLIREELETLYGQEFATFTTFLGNTRRKIIDSVTNLQNRQKILSQLVDKETLRLLREGCLELAKERVNNVYRSCGHQP